MSYIHLFIYSFIHLFIYSFIHLFIHSFIHSFKLILHGSPLVKLNLFLGSRAEQHGKESLKAGNISDTTNFILYLVQFDFQPHQKLRYNQKSKSDLRMNLSCNNF